MEPDYSIYCRNSAENPQMPGSAHDFTCHLRHKSCRLTTSRGGRLHACELVV